MVSKSIFKKYILSKYKLYENNVLEPKKLTHITVFLYFLIINYCLNRQEVTYV